MDEFGGPEQLKIFEKAEPHAGPGEVRIRVEAIAVSPTDTLIRQGQGRPNAEPPYVPGMDAAGVVDEVGPEVEGTSIPDSGRFSVGDEVMAFAIPAGEHGGAYVEYLVGPWQSMARTPAGHSVQEASTLPMNGLTAVQALEKLDLAPGSTIAVTGAAGTLGSYVVQVAKDAQLTVVADASPSDRAWLESIGADTVVERGDDFASAVLAAVPGGVDAVVDTALLKSLASGAVKPGGAFVSFRGWQGDGSPDVRFVVVSVGDEYLSHAKLDRLRALASSGAITLRVAGVLPAASAPEAHRRLEAGGTRGRFVLTF
ncbi:NADP-dependent oxidoreductase [Frondihabitans cladoniiphilus]|uniref:NADP-dependent oxidoreductase n=1 Tax=Frondihabitans cladoniiphilus TaxID=715785 RepID=A0ABP8VYU7_9MICO